MLLEPRLPIGDITVLKLKARASSKSDLPPFVSCGIKYQPPGVSAPTLVDPSQLCLIHPNFSSQASLGPGCTVAWVRHCVSPS
jgi:hypothetical protein